MLTALAVEGYRSLRSLVVPLGPVTVVTGANGTGKSTLYRAVALLARVARDGAIAALARQGGLASALWAGPERPPSDGGAVTGTLCRQPVGVRLGVAGDGLGYAVVLGLPPSTPKTSSLFGRDPEIKRECVWAGPVLRPATLLCDRAGGAVRLRDDAGGWRQSPRQLAPSDSVLSEVADPQQAPELLTLRERLRAWRFYDALRTDADAPARRPQVGTRTPVLADDGADLAAALQTIRENGDAAGLDEAVDTAFPGARVGVVSHEGVFDLAFHQPGLLRPLAAAELSDGTLRYLMWAAALLTLRPPPLLVVNEPETSVHPRLLPALADLLGGAGRRTQVVVVTHSPPLVAALDHADAVHVELVLRAGATEVAGQGRLDAPAWSWPSR